VSNPRRCLVVGYDRSESSRGAVRWAGAELAPDGKLVLVHASRPLHAPASPLSTQQERRDIGRAMIDELLLESEGSLLDLEIVAEISDGDPVTALTHAASEHRAHAIVIGSDRHSALQRAVGTVTSELLATSPVAVIAVPSSDVLAKAR
jgi:nucleotide-binding universal stress UspA family protein